MIVIIISEKERITFVFFIILTFHLFLAVEAEDIRVIWADMLLTSPTHCPRLLGLLPPAEGTASLGVGSRGARAVQHRTLIHEAEGFSNGIAEAPVQSLMLDPLLSPWFYQFFSQLVHEFAPNVPPNTFYLGEDESIDYSYVDHCIEKAKGPSCSLPTAGVSATHVVQNVDAPFGLVVELDYFCLALVIDGWSVVQR